mgnify:CR=1 FL=1
MSEANGASLTYPLPSLLYCMQKPYKKLVKLNTKAQDCVSREKAQKIIKKAEKLYAKAHFNQKDA